MTLRQSWLLNTRSRCLVPDKSNHLSATTQNTMTTDRFSDRLMVDVFPDMIAVQHNCKCVFKITNILRDQNRNVQQKLSSGGCFKNISPIPECALDNAPWTDLRINEIHTLHLSILPRSLAILDTKQVFHRKKSWYKKYLTIRLKSSKHILRATMLPGPYTNNH